MARGGYRAGAGRPRGAPTVKTGKKEVKAIKAGAKLSKMTPLEYMLAVMNSDDVEDERRDKMAIAAAPYVHERAADKKLGKKDMQREAAENIANKFATRQPPKMVIDNTK